MANTLNDTAVETPRVTSDSSVAIAVRNVGKMYRLYDHPQDRLKEQMFWRFGKHYGREFWALRDVSFDVAKGEALGIIGRNGSGKSTLLQIIAGILAPTEGEVRVQGRVAALLELGSGFNPEFTGRENVLMNATVLGLAPDEIEARYSDIVVFAGIGDFIDQPVKLYSSGMFVRLAFAVQAFAEPNVLIVDEVLSVGDIFFQRKCHARLEELLARGTALLFVSHDMGAVEKYCSAALLLNEGRTVYSGKPHEAVAHYYYLGHNGSLKQERTSSDNVTRQSGNAYENPLENWPPEAYDIDLSTVAVVGETNVAKCTTALVCDLEGRPCTIFEIGETAVFYYEFEILQDILVPVGGVTIITSKNIPIHSKNSLQHMVKAPEGVSSGSRVRFRQTIKLDLAEGKYIFNVGLGTISAACYARADLMSPAELEENYARVIGIANAGSFDIILRQEGQPRPFFGYVDLDGECGLDVLPS